MTAAERARLREPEGAELGERLEGFEENAERGYGIFSDLRSIYAKYNASSVLF